MLMQIRGKLLSWFIVSLPTYTSDMQESHAPSLAQSGGLESSTRPCAVYIASSLMYCGKPNQHQDRRSSEWTYKILKRPLSEVKSVEVRRHWICDAVDCGQLWQWLVVPVVTLSSWRRRGTGKSDGFLLYITTTSHKTLSYTPAPPPHCAGAYWRYWSPLLLYNPSLGRAQSKTENYRTISLQQIL